MSPDTKHPNTPGNRDTGEHQCLVSSFTGASFNRYQL